MTSLPKLLKEPRVVLMILLVTVSIIALKPSYYVGKDGKGHLNTSLKFGLDIQGGLRALIYVEDQSDAAIQKTESVIETRLNAYGLKEMVVRPVELGGKKYLQLEIAGFNEKSLRELLESQGKFEARIPRVVEIKNGKGTFVFDGKSYNVVVLNSTTGRIALKGNGVEFTLEVNDTFNLDNVSITYANYTQSQVVFSALIYGGDDITTVFRDVEHARIEREGDGYRFMFSIITTKNSAERFAKVTRDMKEVFKGKECYLNQPLQLYMDNVLMDSLNIVCSLKGEALTMPTVTGWAKTREEALQKMKKLQSILESGALPSKIEIVSVESISPTLGEYFMKYAILSILVAILGVGIVILVRYRHPLISLCIMITLIAELIIILGIAALIGWTIDLPSIAGIVAIIGTGVDHQIIITDETLERVSTKKKISGLSLKQRLKRALTIILTAAATVTAAMFPMMVLNTGVGVMKGFAVTTLIGVWIGVLVTRPAYSKIVEHIITEKTK